MCYPGTLQFEPCRRFDCKSRERPPCDPVLNGLSVSSLCVLWPLWLAAFRTVERIRVRAGTSVARDCLRIKHLAATNGRRCPKRRGRGSDQVLRLIPLVLTTACTSQRVRETASPRQGFNLLNTRGDCCIPGIIPNGMTYPLRSEPGIRLS